MIVGDATSRGVIIEDQAITVAKMSSFPFSLLISYLKSLRRDSFVLFQLHQCHKIHQLFNLREDD